MNKNELPTLEYVRERLSYDQANGKFIRLKGRPDRVGCEPGSIDSKGARQIRVGGRLHLAHRLAWLMMTGSWPASDIDHKDGNPSNNSWENLRLASDSQNQANARKQSNNTSGYKGVYKQRCNGKWNASIRVQGESYYLGAFETVEQASAAYFEAARLHFGEFARS